MKKRGIYWVTIGPDPYMATCQRCGNHERPPELPIPLTAFVQYCRYVQAKHQYCLEKGPPPPPDHGGLER
jgi:hypothetical protein